MDSSADLFGSLFALSFVPFTMLINLLYCFMCLVGIAGSILWIVMLIDAIGREEKQFPNGGENQKILWIIILLFGGAIGALIYYIMVYKKVTK